MSPRAPCVQGGASARWSRGSRGGVRSLEAWPGAALPSSAPPSCSASRLPGPCATPSCLGAADRHQRGLSTSPPGCGCQEWLSTGKQLRRSQNERTAEGEVPGRCTTVRSALRFWQCHCSAAHPCCHSFCVDVLSQSSYGFENLASNMVLDVNALERHDPTNNTPQNPNLGKANRVKYVW